MPPALQILVLAAGSSSRMAPRDKLLETVDGRPLLERITRFAVETGALVTVVLPPDRPLRRAALSRMPVRKVIAQTAAEGMAESLKAGLAEMPTGGGVMLLLADMPELTSEDLKTMIDAARANPDAILRATSDQGQPGHPVIFPASLRDSLMQITGDQGARDLISAHQDRLILVPLPAQHAVTDLDTPEAWSQWRQTRRPPAGAS
ncbi:nucleotidyltransferase family protein [Pseudotabrizicola sp. L79]|uniref:nucleotidyltransferase family protein n=1 Tax=Pseudotabrizicola sp. L79 TaxID=3118402 RepID=UPI002F93213A